MTAEEAKANQDRIVEEGWDLGFWYGTNCNKCCGVYPKLVNVYTGGQDLCCYECEVCGRKTAEYTMPWLARDAWNNGEFAISQGALF